MARADHYAVVFQDFGHVPRSSISSSRSTATLRSTPTSFLPRAAGEDEGGGLNVLNYLNGLNDAWFKAFNLFKPFKTLGPL